MEENKETTEVKNEEVGEVVTQDNTNKDEVVAVEKTFTQTEVNALLKKEKEKINKKYEGFDIEKYNQFVESQKTAEEKYAELQANFDKLTLENNALKNEKLLVAKGVREEFQEFVADKVSKMEGDFETNLNSFLEANKQYLGVEKVATGTPTQRITNEKDDGVIAILKERHPEMNL